MLGVIAAAGSVKNIGMQAIDDETPLLFVLHEACVAQDAEMVRDVDDLGVEQGGQFADIAGAAAETVDDPQSFRVRQGSEGAGAAIGLQWLAHDTLHPMGFIPLA